MSDQAPEKDQKEARKTGGWYAHYVLFVLVIVYIFNFIDRNILSILSQEIQKDLGVSDAEMGFLYGTVFAVFYAVFGIPLARFADVYVRKNLISVGLMFWSAMTALSGFAKSFPQLALFRIGVGVGEASASPAAFSMLSDYYAPKVRATVLAIYSSGVYIGGGIGLFLGGFVMETWDATYVVQSEAPMGIRGWQAAFLAVGIPGILMAFWVWTLKEPQRGQSEGLITEVHPTPFKVLGTELAAMLPIINLIGLRRLGVSLPLNLAMGGAIAAAAYVLILITDNIPQWVALGLGVYVTVSWVQALKARDPATHAMMFKAKGLIYTLLAFPSIAFVTYGIGYWTAPLLLRLHDTSPAEVGMYIGLGSAAGGLIGVTLGGIIGDWAKSKHPAGRLIVGYLAILGTAPLVYWMVYTESLMWAYALNFFHHLFSAAWPGIPPSTASDLVMPRMRAVASAYYILVNTMIGLAMGPYFIGQLSDVYAADGMNSAESLQLAMTSAMGIFVITFVLLTLAWRHLPKDEATRLERAKALGERVETAP